MTAPDPIDAIASALAQLRGRRGARPPWIEGDDRSGRSRDDRYGHGHGRGDRYGRDRDDRGDRDRDRDDRDRDDRDDRDRDDHRGHHSHHHDGPPLPPWAGGMRGGRFAGPARLRALEALVQAGAALTVSEIADAVGVDQPRASRLVQQSVELGLVRREADPDDARRTRVALTDQGSAIVRGFRGERRDLVADALADFTDQERADLARLLSKLAASWPHA